MSKGKKRSLFDEHGHRIGQVEERGAHHRPNYFGRILILVAVIALGYWLNTPRGRVVIDQIWSGISHQAHAGQS